KGAADGGAAAALAAGTGNRSRTVNALVVTPAGKLNSNPSTSMLNPKMPGLPCAIGNGFRCVPVFPESVPIAVDKANCVAISTELLSFNSGIRHLDAGVPPIRRRNRKYPPLRGNARFSPGNQRR